MTATLANLAVAAGVLLSGLALLLAVVGWVAYRRLRHPRLLWVAVAFAGFVAQGVLFTLEAYQTRGDPSLPVLPLLSLGIVIVLYLAVLKR